MEFFIFYIFHYVDILYFVYSLIRCGWTQVDFYFFTSRNNGLYAHFCVDVGF